MCQKYNFYLYNFYFFKKNYCVRLNLNVTPANVLDVLYEFAINGSVTSCLKNACIPTLVLKS